MGDLRVNISNSDWNKRTFVASDSWLSSEVSITWQIKVNKIAIVFRFIVIQ
jgi:hypothetical protein